MKSEVTLVANSLLTLALLTSSGWSGTAVNWELVLGWSFLALNCFNSVLLASEETKFSGLLSKARKSVTECKFVRIYSKQPMVRKACVMWSFSLILM